MLVVRLRHAERSQWAGPQFDLALVLAVDISSSMEGEEQNPQRTGFAEAFRSSLVHDIDLRREPIVDVGRIAARRVIDVSGDGPNKDGRKIALARDDAVAEGIAINGLPIMFARAVGSPEMERLDVYYRERVIGGAVSFMIPLHDPEQFAMVIRTKIMREIAGLEEDMAKLVPALGHCELRDWGKAQDLRWNQRKQEFLSAADSWLRDALSSENSALTLRY
jgi:hypothetical protein